MRALLALLFAASLLAGCAQPATPETPQPETSAGERAQTAEAPSGGRAVFARFAPEANVDHALELTGAFSAQEMGGVLADARAALGMEPANLHVHDLSPHVPIGVPTRLRFEVISDPGQGDLDAWIRMEPESIWWAYGEAPLGGTMWFEYHVMRQTQEPVELILRYDEPGEHPEVPYVVKVEVNGDSETLRAGVPSLLAVPEGATALLVETDTLGENAAVLVWGPQDDFLGRVPLEGSPTRIDLPEGEGGGDHVLMLSTGVARARVAVVGATSEPLMRPVAREVVAGEAQQGESSASWTFTTTRVPLMVGLSAQGGEVAHEFEATLTSEAGTVLSMRAADEVPWLLGVGFGSLSAPGDPNVVAGTYTADVAFTVSAGVTPFDAMEILVFYKR